MSWIRELKYRFADRFFEYELDEAFRLGQIAGRQNMAAMIRVEMEYKKTRIKNLKLTKTQEAGYDKAMEIVFDLIK